MQVLTTKVPCSGNGTVVLPFGHPNYLGLGLVVFVSFIVIELFGSPFIKNAQVKNGKEKVVTHPNVNWESIRHKVKVLLCLL